MYKQVNRNERKLEMNNWTRKQHLQIHVKTKHNCMKKSDVKLATNWGPIHNWRPIHTKNSQLHDPVPPSLFFMCKTHKTHCLRCMHAACNDLLRTSSSQILGIQLIAPYRMPWPISGLCMDCGCVLLVPLVPIFIFSMVMWWSLWSHLWLSSKQAPTAFQFSTSWLPLFSHYILVSNWISNTEKSSYPARTNNSTINHESLALSITKMPFSLLRGAF